MSHIISVKKLLSDDLKSLIKHLTRFEEGSSDFKRCENAAWSMIFDRTFPSVNEFTVKSNLNGFVDKFKVHGFQEKARKLVALIQQYTNHSYFKTFSNTEVQWGLVDILMKLSYKPTDALVGGGSDSAGSSDDDEDKRKDKANEDFDWTSYLKEGLEKFHLPYESGDSLSDWSDADDDEEDEGRKAPVNIRPSSLPLPRVHLPAPVRIVTKPETRGGEDTARQYLDELKDGRWWENPNFRQLPDSAHPEANYCLYWEEVNNLIGKCRLVHEYKVVSELVYLLGCPSGGGGGHLVSWDRASGDFRVTPDISTSSLSPDMFSAVIDVNFCRYLKHIKKLQDFCRGALDSYDVHFYSHYSYGLRRILKKFTQKLIGMEKKLNAQDGIVTIRSLLCEVSPDLYQLNYLSEVHSALVPADGDGGLWGGGGELMEAARLRGNYFRLLNGLYRELKEPEKWKIGPKDWPKRNILILLVDSLKSFLYALACHLLGSPDKLISPDFILSLNGTVLVEYPDPDSREFWEPIFKAASTAIASSQFLSQFNLFTTFFHRGYSKDVLFVGLVEKLVELLLYKRLRYPHLGDRREVGEVEGEVRGPTGGTGEVIDLFGGSARPTATKSPTDWLYEILEAADLWTFPLDIILQTALVKVIEDHMEPKGFANEILLVRLCLLDHLRSLYSCVQVTSIFSSLVIRRSNLSLEWNEIYFDFKNCLYDVFHVNFAENFKLQVDSTRLKKITSILNFPDLLKLHYQISSEIRPVISEETINGYSEIFCFLLKIRLVLASLSRLMLERLEIRSDNVSRCLRLSVLRTWFLHAINSINFYFSSFTDHEFQENIKELCFNTQRLHVILDAHLGFIDKWRYHCFLSYGHPSYEHLMELLKLSQTLRQYWRMEERGQLADFHLDDLEEGYCSLMRNFALSLKDFDEDNQNEAFNFLCDEICNNQPLWNGSPLT